MTETKFLIQIAKSGFHSFSLKVALSINTIGI